MDEGKIIKMEKKFKQHPLYKEDLSYITNTSCIGNLKGKSILITGATGLLGVNLIDALMASGGIHVYAVGRSKDKAVSRLGEYYNNSNFCFLEQDVRQPFSGNLNVDYIIPLASNTHPLAYSQYPIETIEINVKGTEHALRLAERCGATVLYPSTVEIYGNAIGNDVFTEDYTGNLSLSTSRSCYTESKRVCEAMCQSFIAERGVKVKIVRLCRVFGPTMMESDSKASSQFIKKAIAGEDIVLKSKGDQYFSYIYVSDAVAAMLHVLIDGDIGVAYNISNDKCNVHLRDLAQMCADCNCKEVVYDFPSEVEMKGFSLAMQAILDNRKLKSIGFESKYTMKDAVSRTVEILK